MARATDILSPRRKLPAPPPSKEIVMSAATPDTKPRVKRGGVLSEIHATNRHRNNLVRAKVRLENQVFGICWGLTGGGKAEGIKLKAVLLAKKPKPHPLAEEALLRCFSQIQCIGVFEDEIKPTDKRLKILVRALPVFEWWNATHGLGEIGLAQVIAETGDLSNYANPSRVWKRMGCAVGADGKRQRKVKGGEALEQGYSPKRHSVICVITDKLLMKKNPYKDLYDERKAYLTAKWPDRRKKHLHLDAQRYVGKRLLRELWRAWCREEHDNHRRAAPIPALGAGV